MKDRLFILLMSAAAVFCLTFFFSPKTEAKAPPAFPEKIRLLEAKSGEITELTALEYIEGCICAQIPIDYEQEALNAQGCAAASYALWLMPGLALGDADISDDARVCQPYFTEAERISEYGESYEKYRGRVEKAAAYGLSHILTYENEPVCAVYHSVSAGRTCPAEYVWGNSFPYLKSVDSPADKSFINFDCVNEMTTEQACVKLMAYKSDLETPVDFAKWFSEPNVNEDGYVISIKIGKNTFSGGDIWRIFGLRSTAFTVSYSGGIFTFRTKGYGHGAGLSQYGANELAKRGYTAEEILRHYYGEEIKINY